MLGLLRIKGWCMMKKSKTINKKHIESKIQSIGIDLSLIESLAVFIDDGIANQNIKNSDIANLVVILNRLIKILKLKYDLLERVFDI